jgi:hypothetical protein
MNLEHVNVPSIEIFLETRQAAYTVLQAQLASRPGVSFASTCISSLSGLGHQVRSSPKTSGNRYRKIYGQSESLNQDRTMEERLAFCSLGMFIIGMLLFDVYTL